MVPTTLWPARSWLDPKQEPDRLAHPRIRALYVIRIEQKDGCFRAREFFGWMTNQQLLFFFSLFCRPHYSSRESQRRSRSQMFVDSFMSLARSSRLWLCTSPNALLLTLQPERAQSWRLKSRAAVSVCRECLCVCRGLNQGQWEQGLNRGARQHRHLRRL